LIFPNRMLADSGFWIGLLDPSDQYYASVKALNVDLERGTLLIPWPVLYETFSWKLAKHPERVARFLSFLKRSNIQQVDDGPYREDALRAAYREDRKAPLDLSLADRVIRAALEDRNLVVRGLITFDPDHFRDVCGRRGIQIVPQGGRKA
jgi:predicted nucleic acid-binding protein